MVFWFELRCYGILAVKSLASPVLRNGKGIKAYFMCLHTVAVGLGATETCLLEPVCGSLSFAEQLPEEGIYTKGFEACL